MKILVTGGAGFIGSALIRHLINNTDHEVLNVDKLTYAGNLESLASISHSERYKFTRIDICERAKLACAFASYNPDIVMHLAAESHVDRSINSPAEFIQTNIIGTYNLLEVSRSYYENLSNERKKVFRFHHVSTDEVYGDLECENDLFTETTSYMPSSPYSASKASSDHLVRAWYRTFGLPVVLSNCSNNYGAFQFPEKLIPQVIFNALNGKELPVYGQGNQIRDWLYVDDHVKALLMVATEAEIGSTYNIGGHNEKKNIDVVLKLCELLEELYPKKPRGVAAYSKLIKFVEDRPGHDLRYAIDATKIAKDLGWKPIETFDSGLRKTVQWYLENPTWWGRVLDGKYSLERDHRKEEM